VALPGLDLRDGVKGLTRLASNDLNALWRQVRTAAEAETALRDILPALIDTYGLAAGTLAANWYDDLRDKVGAKGRFTAIPADITETGAQALVGWAGSKATDLEAMQALILGGTQRRIANFSRLTVSESSVADPGAVGWARIGSGECAFCAMLIGRGDVYSESSADFAAHDHCNCSAYPVLKGAEPIPVKDYVKSAKNDGSDRAKADYARARDYIATH